MSDTGKERTFTPKEVQELDDEARPVATFAIQMRAKNAETISQIEAMGGSLDITPAKLDHILVALCDIGVITDLQMWQIHADWERNLRAQLKPQKETMQGIHQQRMRQRQEAAARDRLILPPGVRPSGG
jgi:hypothetical protein